MSAPVPVWAPFEEFDWHRMPQFRGPGQDVIMYGREGYPAYFYPRNESWRLFAEFSRAHCEAREMIRSHMEGRM